VLFSQVLQIGFGTALLVSAGQTSQIIQDVRQSASLLVDFIFRQINAEDHLGLTSLRPMLDSFDDSSELLLTGQHFKLVLLELVALVYLDHISESLAFVQVVYGSVDVFQSLVHIADVRSNRQFPQHYFLNQFGHIRARLPASESSTFPHSSSH